MSEKIVPLNEEVIKGQLVEGVSNCVCDPLQGPQGGVDMTKSLVLLLMKCYSQVKGRRSNMVDYDVQTDREQACFII